MYTDKPSHVYDVCMQASDLVSLANDCRILRMKHGGAMNKLERMRHTSLIHRMEGRGIEWKRALRRAVLRTPIIRFPYGIEAAGVTTYSSIK